MEQPSDRALVGILVGLALVAGASIGLLVSGAEGLARWGQVLTLIGALGTASSTLIVLRERRKRRQSSRLGES